MPLADSIGELEIEWLPAETITPLGVRKPTIIIQYGYDEYHAVYTAESYAVFIAACITEAAAMGADFYKPLETAVRDVLKKNATW